MNSLDYKTVNSDISRDFVSSDSFDASRLLVENNYYKDDLSLVDIAASIWRYRLTITFVLLLCLIVGGCYGVFRPLSYTYLSVVEIGSYGAFIDGDDVGQRMPIEQPENASSRIQKHLAISAVQDYLKLYPDDVPPVVNVAQTQGSNILELSVRGALGKEKDLLSVLNFINNKLIENHDVRVFDIQANYLRKIEEQELLVGRLEAELEGLISESELLELVVPTLNAERDRLKSQIAELKSAVKLNKIVNANPNMITSELALANVMLNDQVMKNLRLIGELEDRLISGIPRKKVDLKKKQLVLERDKKVVATKLDNARKLLLRYGRKPLESEASMIQQMGNLPTSEPSRDVLKVLPSKIVIDPFRMSESNSMSFTFVMAISLGIGLVLGVLSASIFELKSRVKQRLSLEKDGLK